MIRKKSYFALVAVCAGIVTYLIAPGAAEADAVLPSCSAPSSLARLDHAIARTARGLAQGRELRIVAFGSSSTAGTGATSPAKSYPSQLENALREHLPDARIVVLNRGIGGEDAREMLARLERSVLAEHPDLVLWQVGTNAIMDDESLLKEASLVRAGFSRLKAAGTDVIFVDPQFAPKVIRKPHAVAMIRLLQTVARRENVGIFRRFAIMNHWHAAMHIPFEAFTSRDGLHMNDWSYQCMADLLAKAIIEAARLPLARPPAERLARS